MINSNKFFKPHYFTYFRQRFLGKGVIDLCVFVLFVLGFLIFYAFICLEYKILPVLISFIFLVVLPWSKLHPKRYSLSSLLFLILLVGFLLLINWLNVTFPQSVCIDININQFIISNFNLNTLRVPNVDGEIFLNKIQLYNSAAVVESREQSLEDLTVIIPSHEEVTESDEGKTLIFLSEQKQKISPLHSNVCKLADGLNNLLPCSCEYLTNHYVNLIKLQSSVLAEHGDPISLFANAYTHSGGLKYNLPNYFISRSDLNGNSRHQYSTGLVQLNLSWQEYVLRFGLTEDSESLIDNKLVHINFTNHKHRTFFSAGIFATGEREYLNSVLAGFQKGFNFKNVLVAGNSNSVCNSKITITKTIGRLTKIH